MQQLRALWKQNIEPPQDAGDAVAVRVYLTSLMAVVGVALTVAYTAVTIFNWQFSDSQAPWYGPDVLLRTLLTLAASVASYMLARHEHIRLASFSLMSVLFFQLATVSLVEPYNPAISMWFLLAVVMTVVLGGGRAGITALLVCLVWHSAIVLGTAQPDMSIVRDEVLLGSISWMLVWVSVYRVGQALARGLDQVQDANRRLAQERDKLAAIMTGITDGVLAVDHDRRVFLINEAARRLLGLGSVVVLGKHMRQVIALEPLVRCFDRAADTADAWTQEILLRERTLRVSAAPVREVGCVAVMQDITYLKELDRMRADFMATASHDLKNPINIINMAAELMMMKGGLTEPQQGYLQRIQRASQAMISLISDLLEIAHLEAGLQLQLARLDTRVLLEQALEDVRPDAEAKRHRLVCDAPRDLVPIRGDPDSLSRVLMNLLSNALKYTPEGGEVVVRAAAADGFMRIEVADNGIGISPQDHARLFERFYRVASADTVDIEGTGLGLSIVKTIVEQHGGEVWVDSTPGEGSTFGFSVPLATDYAPFLPT